ncbi:hypothetical protein QTP70_020280 [Hemibagrus guttatus]|uniref:Transmembrane protein 211 n=1 Tax=Hemibagrus guttatus TaxID=175788 RepID=A0AAE0PVY3_9TELE|nr:hypothetical protein QTP70_020280 [Hemibagrus guttatus]
MRHSQDRSLGPAIHVDVTLTCTTYLSTVADHVHSFMETVFPDGCGLFQQDNAPCHKAKTVQEWFDEHNNLASKFPRFQSNRASVGCAGQTSRSMETPPRNVQDLKDLLLTSWCQIPQHTFRDLVESMLTVFIMASGLLVYPFGLNSSLVKSFCGNSDIYYAGDCQIGWGYMLAIVGVMLTLFLPFFAKYAPKEQLLPTPLPTLL